MVALGFPACGISVPDLQKRQRAVLLSATQPSCHSQHRSLHGKHQQAQKETTATASPFSCHCRQGILSRPGASLFMPSLPVIFFPSIYSALTLPNLHLLGAQLLLHLPHPGIFFLEVGNTDLLSLCIPA